LFCRYATILAFDVKVERDAQDLADSLGVKIFQADIIYHLFDKFMAYREELKQRKREEFKHIAVFPCKLKVLPQVRRNLHKYQYILLKVVPRIS
jgi:translation initiation factor 5B